jgi:hypothetical protein
MQLASVHQDQIAENLRKLVQDNHVAREQDCADKEMMKTQDPWEMLGEVGLQKLMYWSQGQTADYLEGHGHCQKSQQLAILQWAIDKSKDNMEDMELQVLITPVHLEMVKNLRFTMLTTNHVAKGIQPFQFPE